MATLTIEAVGFERVFAVLDKLENPDWSDLMGRIGGSLESQTLRHFVEERGPEGPWQELAPSTIKAKGHDKILQETNILKGSFVQDPRGPYEIALGTRKVYGKYHQEGRGVPRRMILGLHDEDVDEIEATIQGFIDDYMGA